MSEITISNELLKTVIDPDYGAAVKALYLNKDGNEIEIMPDCLKDNSSLDASSFLMLPYSNRIENGKFTFDGKEYRLKNAEKHSIHGDTRKRKWSYSQPSQDRIVCSFDSTDFDDINWPWPFSAEVDYSLSGNTFTSNITLKNKGNTSMPAGFGWHPYYNRSLTQENEPVFIQFETAGVYPDINNNCIPSGNPEKPSEKLDFSKEKQLDPKVHIDNCYQGYDGKGYIAWPNSGIKASYECSSECTHVIFYNPDASTFAFEPATNANNGVNHFEDKDFKCGTVSLNPGEVLSASFSIIVDIIS
jgi:aldose 1-epimerase